MRRPADVNDPLFPRSSTGSLIAAALLAGNTVLMLYPIVIMVFSAFKTTVEIFDAPFSPPDFAYVENFRRIWGETSLPGYFVNSVVITGTSIGLTLLLGTMGAYALARYRFPGNSAIFMFFLAGLMLPLKLAVIPLFLQMRDFGLLDTRIGLILIYTAMGLPSTIFIMTGFLRTLPVELEEAARIDGASEPRIMLSIMLPLSVPPMVIAAIQNAVPTWNDFFFPLVFIQSDSRKTLPQGLSVFMGEYTTDWGMLFAGLTIAALPLTVIYILMSRQFIRGMTAGAVK
ncbi:MULTISPECIES: carbohydrate ABC transporter permease [unclassified Bosea (in: a-proteobacteria)]|uniref:carbohydrate ABC transporter permease n=1 Tax=unclassified Bosea (in: a-proteobacteria) TaxID=2653178 RepID=UPI000957209F|nr:MULTISPECIES: carbohydrate ABC transporter permease [unclassified Bosea (in: a-proteobacteria)]SIR17894.1 raffinose/stachyose/melibiose transport system permease protein [Bosea sp. TND4EK4]